MPDKQPEKDETCLMVTDFAADEERIRNAWAEWARRERARIERAAETGVLEDQSPGDGIWRPTITFTSKKL